ncbi:MAG: methylated-DNA--[Tidjanibacter sp.]|nr:methylated-DNA--[protein]-cysteine S-methyltransferase [Tidjanibacter sp.]MBR3682438.1 methylated-DNA--[protein]-cysteine S-methyltransferase [Tidjanibacter sp.]MBR7130273.1 methylated-DNA--[protein]-cysteine S-methyltransferase [Tidjanibacter sp.]
MNSLFPFIDKVEHLRESDSRMAQLIERFGYIERNTHRPLFEALVESIVSQQVVSASAERTMRKIVGAVGGNIAPATIASLGREGLRKCGVAARKAEWIVSAAERFESGGFGQEELQKLSNEEVVDRLTSLGGVGRWTAEMLLMFSLGREDVLPTGDLGIRKALTVLYGERRLTTKRWAHYRRLFGPYCTIASFYLWAYANNLPKKMAEVTIRPLAFGRLKDRRIAYDYYPTSRGEMLVASTCKGVCRVAFADDREEALDELRAEFRGATFEQRREECHKQLVRSIERKSATDLTLYLQGTPFERKVWREVVRIPYGITASYADIAARTGYTKAYRSVGNAVGANPVAIVIPCHRIIHADGTLGDYNAGAEKKHTLLEREREINTLIL